MVKSQPAMRKSLQQGIAILEYITMKNKRKPLIPYLHYSLTSTDISIVLLLRAITRFTNKISEKKTRYFFEKKDSPRPLHQSDPCNLFI